MMNKRPGGHGFTYIAVTAVLLLTGCAGLYQPSVFNNAPVTFERLRQLSRQNEHQIKTLEGWAKLTIKSPMQGFSADTHVMMIKPDSIYFKIEAAFGIDVGVFFADRSRYLLYTPMQNLSYSGSVDSLQKSPFIDLDITYDQLLRSVSGSEHLINLDDRQIIKNDDNITLTGTENGLTYQYTFHPRYGYITRLEITGPDGELVARHEYGRFTKINGVRVPLSIRIIRPERQEMLSLFYSRLRINKKINKDRFDINLPKNVLNINL